MGWRKKLTSKRNMIVMVIVIKPYKLCFDNFLFCFCSEMFTCLPDMLPIVTITKIHPIYAWEAYQKVRLNQS